MGDLKSKLSLWSSERYSKKSSDDFDFLFLSKLQQPPVELKKK